MIEFCTNVNLSAIPLTFHANKNFIIDIKETMKDVGIIETIEFDYQEIDEKIENDERKKRILRPRFRGREWNISLMTN